MTKEQIKKEIEEYVAMLASFTSKEEAIAFLEKISTDLQDQE